MGSRMLRDWTNSDKIDSISFQAEVFFTRLIMKADDFGCFWADSKRLKANLFPLRSDSVRDADITRWKAECQKAGLIVVYESDSKEYLQIIDFGQRLRLRKQKFPLPDQSICEYGDNSEAYVYFFGSQDDDSVKIGYSLNPWARVKEIATGNHKDLTVIGVFKGLVADEKELHKLFDKQRIKGEWFSISSKLKSIIERSYSSSLSAKELIVELRSCYVSNRSVPEVEEEVEEKKEVELHKHVKKKGWNTRPGKESMNLELPEIKIGAVIQQYRFTKNIKAVPEQVLGLWEVFKSQHFTGEKYYQSPQEAFSHFINWSKTRELPEMATVKKATASNSVEKLRKLHEDGITE